MNEKLVTVADNCVKLRHMCTDNHYIATVSGNGTETQSFPVPFEPEAFWLVCTDPVLRTQDGLVAYFTADLGALGFLVAVSQCSSGGAYNNLAMSNTSVMNRYSYADGAVTLHNITAKSGYGVFAQGVPYTVIAVKYTDKTDKERFTEMVSRLTGSGTVQVWGEKVHKAFTDEEWAALIATKPDWTFEEV